MLFIIIIILGSILLLHSVTSCSQSKESKIITLDGHNYLISGKAVSDLIIEEINCGGADKVDYERFIREHN